MQRGGVEVEEGWCGGVVAQARARGWRVDDGGSTEFCDGDLDSAGAPATNRPREHVSEVLGTKGNSGSYQWRVLMQRCDHNLELDLTGSEEETPSICSLGANGQARLQWGGRVE